MLPDGLHPMQPTVLPALAMSPQVLSSYCLRLVFRPPPSLFQSEDEGICYPDTLSRDLGTGMLSLVSRLRTLQRHAELIITAVLMRRTQPLSTLKTCIYNAS